MPEFRQSKDFTPKSAKALVLGKIQRRTASPTSTPYHNSSTCHSEVLLAVAAALEVDVAADLSEVVEAVSLWYNLGMRTNLLIADFNRPRWLPTIFRSSCDSHGYAKIRVENEARQIANAPQNSAPSYTLAKARWSANRPTLRSHTSTLPSTLRTRYGFTMKSQEVDIHADCEIRLPSERSTKS